jgi:hypothetical protein
MPALIPAPHLWHVGLAPARGRTVHTTVCPVDVELGAVLDDLRLEVPGSIAWIPPYGYAHLTLDASDTPPPPLQARIDTPPVGWQTAGVSFAAYSIRLVVDAPDWPGLFAALGLPGRPCYLTVGYALEHVTVPPAAALDAVVQGHRLHGRCGRVERRLNDPGSAPFRTRTVAVAELSG